MGETASFRINLFLTKLLFQTKSNDNRETEREREKEKKKPKRDGDERPHQTNKTQALLGQVINSDRQTAGSLLRPDSHVFAS